jgi:hypothetical protein
MGIVSLLFLGEKKNCRKLKRDVGGKETFSIPSQVAIAGSNP